MRVRLRAGPALAMVAQAEAVDAHQRGELHPLDHRGDDGAGREAVAAHRRRAVHLTWSG